MYLVEKHTRKGNLSAFEFVATQYAKFSRLLIEKAERIEWWGTSFSDPGADFNEFKLFDGNDKLIATRIVEGY